MSIRSGSAAASGCEGRVGKRPSHRLRPTCSHAPTRASSQAQSRQRCGGATSRMAAPRSSLQHQHREPLDRPAAPACSPRRSRTGRGGRCSRPCGTSPSRPPAWRTPSRTPSAAACRPPRRRPAAGRSSRSSFTSIARRRSTAAPASCRPPSPPPARSACASSSGSGIASLSWPAGSFTFAVAFGRIDANWPPDCCTNGLRLNSSSTSIR